jgi:hypothetical protein
MTISVYFIEGSRKSACNNDAFSVVRNENELLTIIPRTALKAGQDSQSLKAAFTAAETAAPGAAAEKITATARKLLGLHL